MGEGSRCVVLAEETSGRRWQGRCCLSGMETTPDS